MGRSAGSRTEPEGHSTVPANQWSPKLRFGGRVRGVLTKSIVRSWDGGKSRNQVCSLEKEEQGLGTGQKWRDTEGALQGTWIWHSVTSQKRKHYLTYTP